MKEWIEKMISNKLNSLSIVVYLVYKYYVKWLLLTGKINCSGTRTKVSSPNCDWISHFLNDSIFEQL